MTDEAAASVIEEAPAAEQGETAPEAPASGADVKPPSEVALLAQRTRERWERKQRERQDYQRNADRLMAQERELAQLRQDNERAKEAMAWRERAKKAPFEALEELGATPEQLVELARKSGDSVESLKAKIEAMEAAHKQDVEARARAQQELALREVTQDFLRQASDESKFPALHATYATQRELLRDGWELGQEISRHPTLSKYDYTNEELLVELERRARGKHDAAVARLSRQTLHGTPGHESGSTGQGTTKVGTRTLTNEQAAERGAAPVSIDRLSEKEQNALLAENYRRLSRG